MLLLVLLMPLLDKKIIDVVAAGLEPGHGQLARLAAAAVGRGRPGGAVEVARPARGRTAVVDALGLLGGASRALRPVAVALGLGQAAALTRAIGADLAQGHGRGAAGGLAVVAHAVELEALAVATSVWPAVAFDLLGARAEG